MNVTVVVSGLPNNAPLKELARNISKITDIKDVGTFRVREIPVDSDKRLVGLDFRDGFDAMDALLLLEGVKYKMGDGKQYTLKCRISKDAQHLPYHDDLSESYTVNDGRQSRNYEGGCYSLVPYNETEIRSENAKLSAHLYLLEKKKKIVEAERELLRAKKKLKKEYYSKTDSDSEDDRCHKCSKASGLREIRSREKSHTPTENHRSPSTSRKESKRKRKKSTSRKESKRKRKNKSKKSQSISRQSRSKSRTSRSRSPILEYISRTSKSRSRSPSKALSVFRSSPKIYKSERFSATVTSSSFRKESTKRKRSRSRPKTSDSRSRRSQSRIRRSQSRSRQSQSRSKRSQSRWRRSQSRSRRSRSRSWSSEFKSKRLESEYSYSSRNCLTTSYGARNAVTEIVNIKNYNKHIYLEKKYCRSNDTSTVTKEKQELMRESAKRVEEAAYLVIREIDNLVYNEKQSLDKNDVEIVLSEFKNYVKTEFNKIKTELDYRMSVKEIVRFYRRRRSIEEDKAFLLKLIGELIPKNPKDTVEEKKDDTTQRQRRRSIEMWNDVEEVLQEIPMDILQDIEDNAHESNSSSDPSSQNEETQININIRVSYARPTQENCAKVSDNSSSVSTLKNTLKDNNNENVKNNEIQNEKNYIDKDRPENTDKENKTSTCNTDIKAKDNDDPTNVSKTCCDTKTEKQNFTIDLTNDEGISGDNKVSKPHSNIVSKTNEKELSPVEICTNLPEKIVPQNPLFIIPVKRLMGQMKSYIKECENVHETIQTAIRARLVDLLKDKKNYLKTAEIITLYRSRYPKESDKLFFDDILENMNKEKSEELQKSQ